MKLMKIGAALSCLLVLAGCKDFAGYTTVHRKITLVDGRKNIDIQPGQYSGKLKVNSKKKIVLEMQLPSGKESFTFKTTQNLKKMNSGDRIRINAGVSGQPYAVDGLYDVDYRSGDVQSGTESCTYYTREYRCRQVSEPERCETVTECDPANPSQCATRTRCFGGGGTRTECGYEDVSHIGSRDVEYYYSTTTESVNIKLYDKDQKAVATFSGSESDSDRHTTRTGNCY
ncbi:hypothetical protein [Bdellovibrio sp. HCB337]|uniref:hypothetical protein n=1 Tax=Bdellovibrio sp. HCB337 TaxID=3394358 RepID=UPI0039A578F1